MMNSTSNVSHDATSIIFEDAYRRGEVAAPKPVALSIAAHSEPAMSMMSASSFNKKLKQIEDHLIISNAKKTKLKVFGVTKMINFPKEFNNIEFSLLDSTEKSLFY